jgi:type IV fimbrial biogenesis protein FimT
MRAEPLIQTTRPLIGVAVRMGSPHPTLLRMTTFTSSRARSLAGFTIIELMVTVSIVAILASFAAPSFISMIRRNTITTQTNAFITALNLARSEAIRRGSPVAICKSSDQSTCLDVADGSWSDGWIIFNNPADADPDEPTVDAGEAIIKVGQPLASGYTLASGDFPTHVTYLGNGSSNFTGTFAICHNGELVTAATVLITTLRPKAGLDTDDDDIPQNEAGDDIDDCEAP